MDGPMRPGGSAMANNASAPHARGAFIGRAMPRFEDLRFVRGSGNYTDDVSLPEQSYAAFVRAPHAHARIVSIDMSAARRRPGVLAVLTGEDYAGDGHIGMAHFPNPADANDVSIPTFAPTPERKILDQLQPPLALGCVRFVGEAVAVVVAESPVAARDAAEAVVVEYEVLPAVTDVMEALAGGAPAIWPDALDNLALDCAFGDCAAVEAAIKDAHVVVEQTIRNQRTASAFMEPRRRNLIRRDALPHRTATGLTYDSGDFAGNLERALQSADWDGFPARRREAKKRGRLLGIGVANYVETPVGMPHERVALKVRSEGRVDLVVGTQSSGQGHETSFRQVIADALGIEPEAIDFVGGDSAALASGGGTHSDRSMRLAGALMMESSRSVIEKARRIAAVMLEVDASDIAFSDGLFVAPKRNRRLTVFDIAGAIDELAKLPEGLPEDLRGPLAAEATFTGRIPAYPTGAAVCEVEIDPDTGMIEIRRYSSVDDGGQAINPLILHGQVHGGVAQGVGQAMMEAAVYERGTGQLLSASFLDYGMPRADHFPHLDVELTEDPTKGNALRVKGGGEAGITPSSAVLMNAVMDALSDIGIEHMDMPATPQRVWTAIRNASRVYPTCGT